MIPADILRLAQEAGLVAKGVDREYQLPVQIGRFAELVEKHAVADDRSKTIASLKKHQDPGCDCALCKRARFEINTFFNPKEQ